MMCGGTSDVNDATEETQALVDAVKASVESKTGKSYSQFKAVSYKAQVVAGMNYFIKVQVEESAFVHLRVFKPLGADSSPEFVDSQSEKTKDDLIEYF